MLDSTLQDSNLRTPRQALTTHTDWQAALAAIQQHWGADALHLARPSDSPGCLSTGFAVLDQLLNGGWPRGRLTELWGQPTSGMTTLALRALAAAQAQPGIAVYLDLPAAFDPEYAAGCGVQLSRLLLVRPVQHPIDAAGILTDVVAGGLAGIVVVNASMPLPLAERKPLLAALERTPPALARSGGVLLLLSSHQTPLTSPAAALRLRVEREAWLEAGGGYQTRVAVLKHKAAADGGQVCLPIRLNLGDEA